MSNTKVVPFDNEKTENVVDKNNGDENKDKGDVAINSLPSILDKNPKKLRYLSAKVRLSPPLSLPPESTYSHVHIHI